MQLGSGVAVTVAVAGSCSSNLTPSLGTARVGTVGEDLKRQKKKKAKVHRQEILEPGSMEDNSTCLIILL